MVNCHICYWHLSCRVLPRRSARGSMNSANYVVSRTAPDAIVDRGRRSSHVIRGGPPIRRRLASPFLSRVLIKWEGAWGRLRLPYFSSQSVRLLLSPEAFMCPCVHRSFGHPLHQLLDSLPLCCITWSCLEDLERKGFLLPELISGWLLEEEGGAPAPYDGEVVVLASFYERGFGLPLHLFVLRSSSTMGWSSKTCTPI